LDESEGALVAWIRMEASRDYLCIVRIRRNKVKVIKKKSGVPLEFQLVGTHSPWDYKM
jgi:hypothetical protein